MGMRGSRRQSSSGDAEHPALPRCGGDVPSLGAAVASPALLEGPWDPPSSSQPEPGIAHWEGLGYPGGRTETARQGGGGKGPIPKTLRMALIISQDWEGE